MNKNAIIGIVAILAVAIIGYLLISSDSSTSTVNPPITINQTNTGEPAKKAGAPLVSTNTSPVAWKSSVVVTGTVNPQGAPTTYWFDYGLTSSLGSKTASQGIGSGFGVIPTPAYITGLKAQSEYFIRLSAQNSFGTVSGDTVKFTTNDKVAPTPALPVVTTSNATDIKNNSVVANGSINPKGFETGYWFEFGTDANLGNLTGYQSAGNGTASANVTATLPNLAPLTKYYYRVNAQNQFGTVAGSVVTVTTAGPAAVSKPTVDTLPANKIESVNATLNGNINPNGADTTYWFEYSTDSKLVDQVIKISGSNPIGIANTKVPVEFLALNLSANTKYYYRAVGQNSAGVTNGDTVSFTTKK